jgi:hypothetical protein
MPLRLPKMFFQDHADRALPTPTVLRENARHVWVGLDDPDLPELLADAEHYAHPDGTDCEGLGGLVRSAKATVSAIRAARQSVGGAA